jgi:hypothetical protein
VLRPVQFDQLTEVVDLLRAGRRLLTMDGLPDRGATARAFVQGVPCGRHLTRGGDP